MVCAEGKNFSEVTLICLKFTLFETLLLRNKARESLESREKFRLRNPFKI